MLRLILPALCLVCCSCEKKLPPASEALSQALEKPSQNEWQYTLEDFKKQASSLLQKPSLQKLQSEKGKPFHFARIKKDSFITFSEEELHKVALDLEKEGLPCKPLHSSASQGYLIEIALSRDTIHEKHYKIQDVTMRLSIYDTDNKKITNSSWDIFRKKI